MTDLSKNLLELSQVVVKHNMLQINSTIVSDIELGDSITLPFKFKARVLEPGMYKGFNFKADDIIRNMNTIFKVHGNLRNNELNTNHLNNRKANSTVEDLVGLISSVEYNRQEDALYMNCEVYDRTIAEKIMYKLYQFVSLRIVPISFYNDGFNTVKDFDFEELSIVRNPGYERALITEHNYEDTK